MNQLTRRSHLSLFRTGLKYPLHWIHLLTERSSLKGVIESNACFKHLIYNKF